MLWSSSVFLSDANIFNHLHFLSSSVAIKWKYSLEKTNSKNQITNTINSYEFSNIMNLQFMPTSSTNKVITDQIAWNGLLYMNLSPASSFWNFRENIHPKDILHFGLEHFCMIYIVNSHRMNNLVPNFKHVQMFTFICF